jgi:hypothetical protein
MHQQRSNVSLVPPRLCWERPMEGSLKFNVDAGFQTLRLSLLEGKRIWLLVVLRGQPILGLVSISLKFLHLILNLFCNHKVGYIRISDPLNHITPYPQIKQHRKIKHMTQ